MGQSWSLKSTNVYANILLQCSSVSSLGDIDGRKGVEI